MPPRCCCSSCNFAWSLERKLFCLPAQLARASTRIARQDTVEKLTTSSPLPPRILSVVAATLPPFRWRSHIISRRPTCGNMELICSTCAGSAPRRLGDGRDEEEEEEEGEKKKYRTVKKTRARTSRREGMLSV